MEKIIICKKWQEPEIQVYVTNQEIGTRMHIDDYLESLVEQITNLSFTFTKATLLAKLRAGHANIANEMKQTTKYVV